MGRRRRPTATIRLAVMMMLVLPALPDRPLPAQEPPAPATEPSQTPSAPTDQPESAPELESSERQADIKAIGMVIDTFTSAYNSKNASAIVELFTDEAELSDESGASVIGRENITRLFETHFEENPDRQIELRVESLQFLGKDLAREIGHSTTTTADGASETLRYTVIYVREGGRWLQASVHEEPALAIPAHDRLEELSWLIGEWIDESHANLVHTSCRWSEDGSFLIRDFKARIEGLAVAAGTQRIGWDPAAGRFRSWIFDPDGGYSTGLWSQVGPDQWSISAEGVLADGRSISAKHFLTRVTPDLIRWESVDRSLDGVAFPDLPPVFLVRTPPKPASAIVSDPAPPSDTPSPSRASPTSR